MDEQRIIEAFQEGIRKRAAEHGIEKAAILAPALATLLRVAGPTAGMIATPGIVSDLAKRKGMLGRTFGFLDRGLSHKDKWVSGATHLGTQLATAPIYSNVSESLADAIHKPEEQPPQYSQHMQHSQYMQPQQYPQYSQHQQ